MRRKSRVSWFVSGLLAALLCAGATGATPGPANADAAPANDFFADAISVTPLPYGPVTLDTTYATVESSGLDPLLACGIQNMITNTVWYRYVAPASGAVQVNTFGSNFDTKVGVWQGTAIGNLTQLGCAHKSGVFGQFVAFHAQAGLTYYIQIGGDPGDGATPPYGSLTVTVKLPGTPTPTPTPTPSRVHWAPTMAALGNTLVGPFSFATKIQSFGGYITWKVDGGLALANQTLQVWVYKKYSAYGTWIGPTLLTTRRANTSGVAYLNIRTGGILWLSLRPVLPATGTTPASWGPTSIGRWR